MKNKLFTLLLIVTMIIFVTIGCTPKETPAPPETPQEVPEETPKTGNIDYEDGNYQAELEEDDWQPRVELVVEGGKITEVDYDEFDEEDNPKSKDDEYNQQWESAAGISAPEAYSQLEEELIDKQDVEAVDVVSGATDATKDFKEVVAKAIEEGPQ